MQPHRELNLRFAGGATRVCIGAGLLADAGAQCRRAGAFTRSLVVTDENVARLHAPGVVEAMRAGGIAAELAVVPAGESSKCLGQAGRLYDRLADGQMGRDGLLVAVGGGMVTDLVGFVGATWMRGIATVLCPTTLEADIDAAIGGKTGVNHPAGKNLIGAFHHPRLVLIDTRCLATLSDRDLAAGMAESIKHALIDGDGFVSWHEQNAERVSERDQDTLAGLIERNVRIKGGVVARDEREQSDERARLNLGHTIGHGVEAVCGYRYRHGECVSMGLAAAARLSASLGMCTFALRDRIIQLLEAYALPVRLGERLDEEAVWDRLSHDKKKRGGRLRVVLIESPGRLVVRQDVPEEAIRAAIASLQPDDG